MCGGQDETSRAEHWERIYSERSASEVGWYTARLDTSLAWIASLDLESADPIIDVGGGASTLIDDLLGAGYRDLTVLDLAPSALVQARRRLGEKSAAVTWLQGDVTAIELPAGRYRLWHDRAVFHFLTEPEARMKYRDRLLSALRPGGYLVMGCFGPDAPPQCSGLPVRRYSRECLCDTLGGEFDLKRQQNEIHITPGGIEQAYLYCLFQVAANRD